MSETKHSSLPRYTYRPARMRSAGSIEGLRQQGVPNTYSYLPEKTDSYDYLTNAQYQVSAYKSAEKIFGTR